MDFPTVTLFSDRCEVARKRYGIVGCRRKVGMHALLNINLVINLVVGRAQ